MPKIKVDTKKIRGYDNTLEGIKSDMARSCSDYFSASRHLDWHIKYEANINSRLIAANRQMDSAFSSIKKMCAFLDNAGRAYDYVEEHIGDAREKENTLLKIVKATIKASPVGAIAVGAYDIVSTFKKGFKDFDVPKGIKTAANGAKSVLSIGENIQKIGKSISAAKQTIGSNKAIIDLYESSPHQIGTAKIGVKNGKRDVIKGFLGLSDTLSEKEQAAQLFMKADHAKFGARFSTEFKSSFKESGTKLGKAAGVAGIVLTGITNAVDNYEEYKSGKISGKRAVAETISETAVDTVKDLAIGAAVTAGLAAAFGCAPALAVVGITAGITIGADALTKVITKHTIGEEKGFMEVVSDFVLDTGEKALQGVSNGVRDIYYVGSAPVSAVCVGG